MDLNKLYDLAENEHIKVYSWHIEDSNGIYLNYDKINAIALDYDELGTFIDEKCTLAEELGHYYMDATYNPIYSDNMCISRNEYRAKKFSYKLLVPLDMLKNITKKGITEVCELAEYFEVSYEFMQKCLNYYKELCLI